MEIDGSDGAQPHMQRKGSTSLDVAHLILTQKHHKRVFKKYIRITLGPMELLIKVP